METLGILIVDDHEVVRAGLRTVLEVEGDLKILGEAANADEAVAKAMALRPNVVIMDMRLAGTHDVGGIEACREIMSMLPDTRVVMFSSFDEREAVLSAILAGASGYLLKNVSRSRLCESLRAIGRGEKLLDPGVTKQVLDRLLDLSSSGRDTSVDLSRREAEVLLLVAKGFTNKEIAAELVISEHTARNHVAHILDKLGFSRRIEAAAYAARLGLLEGSSDRAS